MGSKKRVRASSSRARSRRARAKIAQSKPPNTGFTLFPKLPAEVRHRIWYFAANGHRDPETACIFASKHLQGRKEKCQNPLLVRFEGRALLRATTESRAIAHLALKQHGCNYTDDVLFIPDILFITFIKKFLIKPDNVPPWLEKIEHIAVDLKNIKTSSALIGNLPKLPGLKTVTIVFTKTSGYLGPEDEKIRIERYHRGELPIRKLDRADIRRLRFPAETMAEYFPDHYTYNTPIRDVPTVSSVSAQEFIDSLETRWAEWIKSYVDQGFQDEVRSLSILSACLCEDNDVATK